MDPQRISPDVNELSVIFLGQPIVQGQTETDRNYFRWDSVPRNTQNLVTAFTREPVPHVHGSSTECVLCRILFNRGHPEGALRACASRPLAPPQTSCPLPRGRTPEFTSSQDTRSTLCGGSMVPKLDWQRRGMFLENCRVSERVNEERIVRCSPPVFS